MRRIAAVVAVAALLLAPACSDDAPEPGANNGDANNDDNNTPNNGAQNNGTNNGNNGNNGAPEAECGNLICERAQGEAPENCPGDCGPPGPQCGDGTCEEGETPSSCPVDCREDGPECGDGTCDENETPETCPSDCTAEAICDPGTQRCLNSNALETCNDLGSEWGISPCGVGEVCVNDTCETIACRPGEAVRCASQASLIVCDDTGTGEVEVGCVFPEFCDFLQGVYLCTDQVCEPGETRCAGLEGLEMCAEDGTTWLATTPCDSGTQCDNGECRSLCEINSKVSSFLGCEYFSVDFDNIEQGQPAPHAIVISNPTDIPAEVEVRDGNGELVVVNEWPTMIEPGELAVWRFDPAYMNQTTMTSLIDPRHVDGTILTDTTFKFGTSVPTTAHQFNPLADRNVFTNDASLLLPTNAVGDEYLVMSWKHRQSPVIPGFIGIIAFGSPDDLEPTTVTVTPTASVVAGTDRVNNEAIARIATGETREFVMMPGQVLQLETEGPDGADLTGTEVLSDKPVVVFGGHSCANVPLGINYCDHIEQQMYPVPSWGTQYIGAHFKDRDPNTPQVEIWRILSAQDDTVLSTDPPLPNVDGITLNRGEFVEFETSEHFLLSATGRILAGQYMTGSRHPGGNSIGDPAFTLATPLAQWRRDYIVLIPGEYRSDYVNLIARTGTTIYHTPPITDANPNPVEEIIAPDMFETVANGEFSVAQVLVPDGPHKFRSDGEFGVIAYGYDSDVSYAYPGGLNLETINF